MRRPDPVALAALAVLALAVLAALLLVPDDGGDPAPVAFPEVRRPAPLPALERHPLSTPLRVTARDVDATARDGTRLRARRAELVAAVSGDTVRLLSLQVTGGDLRGTLPDGRGYDLQGLSLQAERGLLLDGRPRAVDLRLSGTGTLAGRHLRLTDATARVRDGGRRIAFDLRGGLGDGRLAARGTLVRAGDVTRLRLDRAAGSTGTSSLEATGAIVLGPKLLQGPITADGLRLRSDGVEAADLRALGIDPPVDGRLAGTIALDGPADALAVAATLRHTRDGRTSRLRVDGTVSTLGPRTVALEVVADPVVVADSTLRGRFAVRGPLDDLAITGTAALLASGVGTRAATPTSPASPMSPMSAGQGATAGPQRAAAPARSPVPPVPAAPPASDLTPATAGVGVRVRGLVSGDPTVTGGLDLRALPEALGLRPGGPLEGRVRGRAELAGDGALALTLEADSLPLELLPVPADVDSVAGTAAARIHVAGTSSAPVVHGTIDLAGRARLPGAGLAVSGARGRIRLDDGVVRVDELVAGIGGGTVRARGTVVPGTVAGVRIRGGDPDAPRRVDLRAEVDSVRVLDDPGARLAVTAELHLQGTLDAPVLTGRVRPTGYVTEAFLAPSPGLDPDDPPWADLAARVPWPAASRLAGSRPAGAVDADGGDAAAGADAADGADDPEPAGLLDRVRAELVVAVDHGFELRDEDSRLRGTGEVVVRRAGGELETAGVVALESGYYAQFGQRFDVFGGALVFDGSGLQPRAALRSDYDDEALLVGDDAAPGKTGRFPPIQFLGYGQVGEPMLEAATRYTLVPWTQLQLARHILLAADIEPMMGWRTPTVWRAQSGAGLLGERAVAQGVPLAWSFIGDRLYDFVPLERGYLRPGVITVGEPYPGRLVVAPVLQAVAVVGGDDIRLGVGQPFLTEPPRLSAVYRWQGLRLEAFTGPRFYAGPDLGGPGAGYLVRQRTGVAARWRW